MKIYGIKNCDAVRKAVRFFKSHNIDFDLVDFRVTPVSCETIDRWLKQVPVEKLFNTRGTTYRTLKLKELGLDDDGKREWLCKENTLIKRPVVETDDGRVVVGYNESIYKELFL
ncbi:arsenate reductase family protein [Hydrogenimonas sp.]|jgi:Spx/MgsR family transcriptional regulator|uniref:arsenate reductase family protein n=1 Tax=Hydrogenimonas sp. TaxID=2231112 RepID=UPI002603680F|nr:arsenate reductase family protein [Hydrogenimonas sp.]